MSVADELLKANETFARNFKLGDLAVRPKRHVAVLACMDSRILFEHCLGLHPGDAHMIRNAGGIATEDALRSLIVSHHLLDTQEFIIINHTDCGLLKVREDELKARLMEKMGTVASEPSHFHAFDDLEANVRLQIATREIAPVDSEANSGARVCLRRKDRKAERSGRDLTVWRGRSCPRKASDRTSSRGTAAPGCPAERSSAAPLTVLSPSQSPPATPRTARPRVIHATFPVRSSKTSVGVVDAPYDRSCTC